MELLQSDLKRKVTEFVADNQLLAIILLTALLRTIFFVGVQLGDDLAYIKYAHDLLVGESRLPANHWESRMGLILPLLVSFKMLGSNEHVAALFPVVCSLINVVLIYKIAESLFNAKVAIISALLLSVFPLDLYYSTSAYPTVPLSTMCGLSVYFLLRSKARSRILHYFLSGLFLGLAYLVHETALFLALFLMPYILLFTIHQRLRKLWFLCVGFAVVIALEMGAYTILAHNPLHRANVVSTNVSFPWPTDDTADSIASDQARHSFLRDKESKVLRGRNFWIEPFWALTTQQEFGLYYYLVIPFTIYFLIKRRKIDGIEIILLWLIPLILYLFYGTISPFEYRTLRRWPRYFSMVNFPAIILLGVAFEHLLVARKKLIATLLLLLLICSSLTIVSLDNRHRYAVLQRMVADYVKTHDGVYYAKRTYRKLGFFVNYDTSRIKRYDEEASKETSAQRKTYLIYDEKHGENLHFPVIKVFETPKTISVHLAIRLGLPDIVVQRLWRKQTYFVAQIG